MKCNICNSKRFNLAISISERDRFEIFCKVSKKNFRRSWFECNNCKSLMNSHKKVNENKLKKISKNYYHVDFPNMTPKERLEKLLNIPDHKSDNFFRTQRIINSLQKTQIKKNILDIGAGTGFFIYKLINSKFKNKNKWSFFSHETDKECVKLLKTIKKII